MWTQVSLNNALRSFLEGRDVRIWEEDTVKSLSEVLSEIPDSVVFLVDKDADAAPAAAITIAGLPKGSTLQDVDQMISSAIGRVNDALTATPEPEEAEPEPEPDPPPKAKDTSQAALLAALKERRTSNG